MPGWSLSDPSMVTDLESASNVVGLEFNDKYYMLGGYGPYTATGGYIAWESDDGVTWSKIATATFPQIDEPGHGHPNANEVKFCVHDGYVYAVRDQWLKVTDRWTSKTWRTQDFIVWTEFCDNTEWKLSTATAEESDDTTEVRFNPTWTQLAVSDGVMYRIGWFTPVERKLAATNYWSNEHPIYSYAKLDPAVDTEWQIEQSLTHTGAAGDFPYVETMNAMTLQMASDADIYTDWDLFGGTPYWSFKVVV